MTHSQILNLTSNMSATELIQLNRDLVSIIKHRQKMEAKDVRACLSIGDRVKLTDNDGSILQGTVKKIMRTRAIVNINGINYKVPMNILDFV